MQELKHFKLTNMEYIEQKPIPPNEWLYKDEGENRIFAKQISYRSDKGKPWLECTNEEKEQWEHDHPQPEPSQS